MKMKWNVFVYNHKDKIEVFNVFDHCRFAEDTLESLRLCNDIDSFKGSMRTDLTYYFWCKYEYEVMITSLFNYKHANKVDVYEQVMINFDVFIDYLWKNRDLFLKDGEFEIDE